MVEANSNIISRINDGVGRIVRFIVLVLIGVIMWEIVMRYFFKSPTIWVYETSLLLFATYFLLGGAYTHCHEGHVRVDLLYRRFSPKIRLVLDLFGSIFIFLFTGLLTWEGIWMAWESIKMLERFQSPWRPYIFPVISVVPIAALLMFVQALVVFVCKAKEYFGRGAINES